MKFDLSEVVPEGISVDSANLILTPSPVRIEGTTVSIYMLTSSRGEGTSDADGAEGKGAPASGNDATWTKSNVSGDPGNACFRRKLYCIHRP